MHARAMEHQRFLAASLALALAFGLGTSSCGGQAGTVSGSGGSGTTSAASGSQGSSGGAGSGTLGAASGAGGIGGITGIGTGFLIDGGLPFADALAPPSDDAAAPPPVTSISPQVAADCDTLCAKEATANCPNQGSLQSCVLGCRLLLNNPACAADTMALAACANTSTVSCDATGKAQLDSCPAQFLTSAACFLQNANDPTLAAPCASYCAGAAAAHCPNDTSTGCQQGCQIVGNLLSGCEPDWRAYVTCSNGTTFACGSDGKAWAPSCAVQALTYLACTAGGALTVSDGGR